MPGTSVSGKSPNLTAARSWQRAWSIIKMNSPNLNKFDKGNLNKFDKVKFLQKIGRLNARFGSENWAHLRFSLLTSDSIPQVQLWNSEVRAKLDSSFVELPDHFNEDHHRQDSGQLPFRTERWNPAAYWYGRCVLIVNFAKYLTQGSSLIHSESLQLLRGWSEILRLIRSPRGRVSSPKCY